jgi:hypothetical protein
MHIDHFIHCKAGCGYLATRSETVNRREENCKDEMFFVYKLNILCMGAHKNVGEMYCPYETNPFMYITKVFVYS